MPTRADREGAGAGQGAKGCGLPELTRSYSRPCVSSHPPTAGRGRGGSARTRCRRSPVSPARGGDTRPPTLPRARRAARSAVGRDRPRCRQQGQARLLCPAGPARPGPAVFALPQHPPPAAASPSGAAAAASSPQHGPRSRSRPGRSPPDTRPASRERSVPCPLRACARRRGPAQRRQGRGPAAEAPAPRDRPAWAGGGGASARRGLGQACPAGGCSLPGRGAACRRRRSGARELWERPAAGCRLRTRVSISQRGPDAARPGLVTARLKTVVSRFCKSSECVEARLV